MSDGEEVDEGVENGIRRPKRRREPKEPTEAEREEHEMTHIPFRSWCRHCVRGRGKEEACRQVKKEYDVAEVHMDFMFMGEEGGEETIAVLVGKERSTGMILSTVAPRISEGRRLGK